MKKAMHQHEHEAYNAIHYPGTRQLCCKCDEPTERCEEDAIWSEDGDFEGLPLCEACYEEETQHYKEEVDLNNKQWMKGILE